MSAVLRAVEGPAGATPPAGAAGAGVCGYDRRGELTEAETQALNKLGVTGLRRAGIDSKSSFQVGSTFSFVINPSRNGSPTGLLVTLVFPDGRRFDVRNTDTGQVGGR